MIGDPSGKIAGAHAAVARADRRRTSPGIRAQLARFLDFDARANPARIVNNADWLATIDLLSFLRDVGKHFTVNYMLQKESVKPPARERRRHLVHRVQLPAAAGVRLSAAVRSLRLHAADGRQRSVGQHHRRHRSDPQAARRERRTAWCWPLMTTASGAKFGKTEAGTVWLDPARTSPFQFYQFWLNTDDRDVVRYLKFFTFLDARRRSTQLDAATQRGAGEARGAARAGARGDGAGARRRAGRARRACAAVLFGETSRRRGRR